MASPPSSADPRKNTNHTSNITNTKTAITERRRRQYTPGGNGPTGVNIVLTRRHGIALLANACQHQRVPTSHSPAPEHPPTQDLLSWFDMFCRDLPWRFTDNSTDIRTQSWAILVSEIMLQQTPVNRVLPVFLTWMTRWPTPASLAAADTAQVIRAWGRLGYPRRAMRLHEAARIIAADHDGVVPSDESTLRALPGVGEYTAGAVRAFAYHLPALTLDTNVRRVLARYLKATALPPSHLTRAERDQAWALMPVNNEARWMAALMELGALVCTAKNPACDRCPLVSSCAWVAAGRPEPSTITRRQPTYAGSDRQARGVILALLRDASEPIHPIDIAWPDQPQRDRALASLITDGLVQPLTDGRIQLPV